QVVGEDLQGLHGQVRQPSAGPNHAKHIAKVRAGSHADVLENIDEDFASLQYSLFEHQQTFFQQNYIRRLFGNVDRIVDRDANIGRTQRRGVIDAITHKTDDVSLLLQGLDNPLFVRWGKACKDVGTLDSLGKLQIGHGLDLTAEHDFFGVYPDLATHFACYQVIVSRQHLNVNTVLTEHTDGFGRGVLRGIKEGKIAGQDQLCLVGLRISGALVEFLSRDCQHAKAVLTQIIDLLDKVADQDRFHRKNLALA